MDIFSTQWPLLLACFNCVCSSSATYQPQLVRQFPAPTFWNVTQQQLDDLIHNSSQDLLSANALGGLAKQCNQLPGYTEEQVYHLSNATVVLLDEQLLCADFAETCQFDTRQKKEWILNQAAWFSKPHIERVTNYYQQNERQQVIVRENEIPPHHVDRVVTARRACQAGRALLLPITSTTTTSGPNWIDVKGIGNPDTIYHSIVRGIRNANGLIELQNAIWEYMNEKTVAAALAHHSRHRPQHDHFETVGYYAVLSLGFSITWETTNNGTFRQYPAGALCRQASRRHPNPYGFMPPQDGAYFEQILNAYGMKRDTAENDSRFQHLPNVHCRRVNVQGTIRPRQVVDFGEIYSDPDWPFTNTTTNKKRPCLVHWGKTSRMFDTPLWNDTKMGSKQVREFLRKELQELPPIKNETWPAKEMNSVRQQRSYEAAIKWWIGNWSVAQVEETARQGLIDDILADSSEQSDAPFNSDEL